jgi:hypothetical protein
MNAEEIRRKAIERLARAQFTIDETEYGTPAMPAREWDDVPRVHERYRGDAAPLVDALGELLRTEPDAYVVLSKRKDGDERWPFSGPWDEEATVFVDYDTAGDLMVNWEVDRIESGRNPDIFMLGEVRFEQTPLNAEWLQAIRDERQTK